MESINWWTCLGCQKGVRCSGGRHPSIGSSVQSASTLFLSFLQIEVYVQIECERSLVRQH